MHNAPAFTLFTGIITVAVDLAYLAYTAYLFLGMRARIVAAKQYEPSYVLVSTVMLGISLGLVLMVGFLTLFTKKRGDQVEILARDPDKEDRESNADPEKNAESSNDNELPDIKAEPEPEVNPYHGATDEDACERVKRLRGYRLEIKDPECMEEFATARMQMRFICMGQARQDRLFDRVHAWVGQWRQKRRRHPDDPPNPHDEVHIPPAQ